MTYGGDRNGIRINDSFTGRDIYIHVGAHDPRIGGCNAPIGSIFLRTNGEIYAKNGVESVAWALNGSAEIGGSYYQIKEFGISDLQRDVQQVPDLESPNTLLKGLLGESPPLRTRSSQIQDESFQQKNELVYEMMGAADPELSPPLPALFSPADSHLSFEGMKLYPSNEARYTLYASERVDGAWKLKSGQVSSLVDVYMKMTLVGGEETNMNGVGVAPSIWSPGNKVNISTLVTVTRKGSDSSLPFIDGESSDCEVTDKQATTVAVSCAFAVGQTIDQASGSKEVMVKAGSLDLSTVFGTGLQEGDNLGCRFKFEIVTGPSLPRNLLLHHVDLVMVAPQ